MRKSSFLKAAMTILAVCCCLMSSLDSFAQNKTISGKVVDQNGEPVIGASVMLVGNNRVGTVTDLDGLFSLSVPAGANLTVSSIGYTTVNVAVGDQTSLNITIAEDTEMIEETVVIGYGVQKKSDLTGSVASVKSEDLSDRSTYDVASALQGKAAGIQIISSSAAPGSSSSIRVRGYSSNSGSGLGPLLIVDGLKVSNIDYLDPNMIESMEILKDAASAAIYGAQAGNGVVLITTKSGSKSKDGSIFFQYQTSFNTLGRYADIMNADEFIQWQSEYSDANKEMIDQLWDGKTKTNWADALFGTGISSRYSFGAQGGNDRGSYYFALTYTDQDGIIRGDKDYNKRLTAQINGDYKIKKWFTVGTNMSIERSKRQSVSEGSEYSGSTLLGCLTLDPLTPVTYASWDDIPTRMQDAINGGVQKVYADENGNYYATSAFQDGDGGNPLMFRDRTDSQSEGINIRGTAYANITPFKELVFTSRFGYRIGQSYSNSYSEPYYLNSKTHGETYSISANSSQNYYYQWENFANYNKSLGKHSIGAMAGMSYTFSDSRGVNAGLSGTDPLKGYAPNFRYLSQDNGSGTKSIGGGTPSQSSQISYYGRLTYNYDNRYNFQANFRADAFDSSKLSTKNRWGYFPSFSAGWTISNEEFMQSLKKTISLLKVRASWGINGNIAVLSGYPYSSTINVNGKKYQFDPDSPEASLGSAPSGLANPDLTWETSHQLDLGLDARFFGNKLTLGVDWYNKNTEDLLVTVTNCLEVGITSSTINAGSINNHGLEVELGWQDTIGDFHYSINGNLATLHNKVTFLDETVGRIKGSSYANTKFYTACEPGYPIWYYRGFQYDGVNQEDGTPIIHDFDGDGKITDEDLIDMGNPIPDITYGITLHADWKNFDLTVFGTGAAGYELIPCVYRTQFPVGNGLAYYFDNRWTAPGCNSTMPSIKSIATNIEFWSSSAIVFSGDFFKIKQIQLGYTLPKSLLQKINISSLRIYGSVDDYFNFTKYPGFDPETASTGNSSGRGIDKGTYPNSKKLVFGVNLSF